MGPVVFYNPQAVGFPGKIFVFNNSNRIIRTNPLILLDKSPIKNYIYNVLFYGVKSMFFVCRTDVKRGLKGISKRYAKFDNKTIAVWEEKGGRG